MIPIEDQDAIQAANGTNEEATQVVIEDGTPVVIEGEGLHVDETMSEGEMMNVGQTPSDADPEVEVEVEARIVMDETESRRRNESKEREDRKHSDRRHERRRSSS